MLRFLVMFLMLGLVAGCAYNPSYVVNERFREDSNSYTFFKTATRSGPLWVQVTGSYPGFDQEQLASHIRSSMENGLTRRPFKTTAVKAEAEDANTFVNWIISPPDGLDANKVCRGEAIESTPKDYPSYVAVFCVDGYVYGDYYAWTPATVTPESQEFDEMVGFVTRRMWRPELRDCNNCERRTGLNPLEINQSVLVTKG